MFRFCTISLILEGCLFLVLARLEAESVDDQRLPRLGPRYQPYCQSAARANLFTLVADRAVVVGPSCPEPPAELNDSPEKVALFPTIGRVMETSRYCGPTQPMPEGTIRVRG